MSKNKKDFSHLGIKIENMLDEIIKSDDELDSDPVTSPLKFNDGNSYLEDAKENNNRLLDKDIFSNAFSINEEQPKINQNNSNLNQNLLASNLSGDINKPFSSNINNKKNNYNYNQYYFNHLFSPHINSNINNNNSFNYTQASFEMKSNPNDINLNRHQNFIINNGIGIDNNLNNSNYNNYLNNSQSMNYILLPKNNNKNPNFSDDKSFIAINNNHFKLENFKNYQNFGNYFFKGNTANKFKDNRKNHNSFFRCDKIIINPKINQNYNHKYNKFNKNVEIEMLIIETNKMLIKLEKINQNCYNKLKGKFEQIIRTHKGSRIFQNYLKNTQIDILHQIFLEIKNKLPDLLKDNYANYFCKKFFDCLSQKDRIEYLTIIQNDLGILAIDVTATYPIQGIIEQLGSIAEKNIIYLGIKEYIKIFCYNIYGTYVLEKILSYFEEQFIQEIIDFVYNNFIDLAYHINGICIVKKLIVMTHKKELHEKLKKKIYDNTLDLIVHQYGNYVIQVIIENWEDNELKDIIDLCNDKYVALSNKKYSSNVVERIIEKNKENLENYINQICCENNLTEVIRNSYGNYVIQKAVKLSSGKIREKLIKEIMKNLNKLEEKKIISKWKMIISQTNF